jgi:condensin complex subunit 2
MPRVANPPRANQGRSTSKQLSGSPFKSGVKYGNLFETCASILAHAYRIPLNDDAQEKAVRLQSRQALHDLQMNQIKAAASPMRKVYNTERAGSSSPKTPGSGTTSRDKDNEGDGLMIMGGTGATPMKRVPILANFEEWMKMATDNVSSLLSLTSNITNDIRKSMPQTLGTLLSLTTFTTCHC